MIGDSSDFVRRLRRNLPQSWFSDDAPVLTAVLRGWSATWVRLYAQVSWVLRQLRLNTASGTGLDILAYDFLGDRVTRREGEADAQFRIRVRREILREKITRQAVRQNLLDLTGYEPEIFEPSNPRDTGGYGAGFAFNAAGGWGSRMLNHQAFVTAYRPVGEGPPGISGFDDPPGGWSAGAFALQSPEALNRGITDAVILEAVASTMAAGTVAWVRVRPFSANPGGARLDVDFILDVSRLS